MAIFLLLTAVLLIGLLGFAMDRRKQRVFEERFPPITDAEFIALCGPGTNPDVAIRVRRIVSNCLGVEYERIHPSARFVEDLFAD